MVMKNKIKGIDLSDDITQSELDSNPLYVNPIDKMIGLFSEGIAKATMVLEKSLHKDWIMNTNKYFWLKKFITKLINLYINDFNCWKIYKKPRQIFKIFQLVYKI